jgi:hypothetical protein
VTVVVVLVVTTTLLVIIVVFFLMCDKFISLPQLRIMPVVRADMNLRFHPVIQCLCLLNCTVRYHLPVGASFYESLREPLCSPSIPTPAYLHIRGDQIREFRIARVNRFRTEMAHLRAFDFLLLRSVKVMHCFGSRICFRFYVKYKNFEIRYFGGHCI